MCEPVTIALASAAGASLVGGGIQAYSQIEAGNAQYGIAKTNAQMANRQAGDVQRAGAEEARQIEITGRQTADNARATIVASGVDANSGSIANVPTTSLINAATDAARVRSNAARAAWGYKVEAQNQLTQGKLARRAGYMGALGTGFSTIGNTAGIFAKAAGG